MEKIIKGEPFRSKFLKARAKRVRMTDQEEHLLVAIVAEALKAEEAITVAATEAEALKAATEVVAADTAVAEEEAPKDHLRVVPDMAAVAVPKDHHQVVPALTEAAVLKDHRVVVTKEKEALKALQVVTADTAEALKVPAAERVQDALRSLIPAKGSQTSLLSVINTKKEKKNSFNTDDFPLFT